MSIRYFFVTSYGRTATVWLATALNLHPEILCSHGPALKPIIPRKGAKEEHGAKEGMVTSAQETTPQFNALSLRDILARLAAESHGQRFIGNVHAFTAWNLAAKARGEPDAPPFPTVNLLRHPVARAESFRRRWEYERTFRAPVAMMIETEAMRQPRYRKALAELRRHHQAPMDSFPERAFFHAVMQMSADDGDMRQPVPQVITERLVSETDYFAFVVNILTGGGLPLSPEYLRSVRELGSLNAAEGGGRSPERIFEQWQPWQRTLFRIFLRDHPFLRQAYEAGGYTLPAFSPLAD